MLLIIDAPQFDDYPRSTGPDGTPSTFARTAAAAATAQRRLGGWYPRVSLGDGGAPRTRP